MAAHAQGAELAVKTWLVDTGPWVAYLDRRDAAHLEVAARLDAFSGQLVTTCAVVTEVMYFLAGTPGGPESFSELLTASGVRIVGPASPRDVAAATDVMRGYADTPMDYADATLVLLAGATGVLDILTLDRRGFSTYRTTNRRAFRLVLP